MFGPTERVTVRELMTEDPEHVPADATVAEVEEWLADRGYTAAPVARSDPPHIYVERSALAEVEAAAEPVYRHADRVGLEDLLSPDLGFEGLVRELEDRAFYLVGWHGSVRGIVTRSDLNRPPAHAFLYTRVGEVEMRLRDLVAAETTWRGVLGSLPADGGPPGVETEYDSVERNYREYADADLQLREVDYTTFWQLERVVREDEGALVGLPFSEPDAAADALASVRELRNQVAHYGNVVHNVSAEYLDSGRNVHQLVETYETVEAVLTSLCDWAEDGGAGTGQRPVGHAGD